MKNIRFLFLWVVMALVPISLHAADLAFGVDGSLTGGQKGPCSVAENDCNTGVDCSSGSGPFVGCVNAGWYVYKECENVTGSCSTNDVKCADTRTCTTFVINIHNGNRICAGCSITGDCTQPGC